MTNLLACLLVVIFLCTSCTSHEHNIVGLNLPTPKSVSDVKPKLVDLDNPNSINKLAGSLTRKRALFIGEIHDELEHHQNQLLLIQHLYELYPYIAIGVEFFQQPFQSYVDKYIAGQIDEREMLIKTEYFKRWGVDYRLLQPILKYAKDKRIPIIALNISDEIHHKVFEGGFNSLSAEDRALIPDDIQPVSEDYRDRLEAIYNAHPENDNFESFVEGQQLWDEAMADNAAKYLKQHPQRLLVVLAGLGHMIYGDGIPRSLNRRIGGNYSSIAINGEEFAEYPGIADFILATSDNEQLPVAGMLGIKVNDTINGVFVTGLSPDGAAKAVGITVQDRIDSLDGIAVKNFVEIRSIMFDKHPGDIVNVEVLRGHLQTKKETLQFAVTLR